VTVRSYLYVPGDQSGKLAKSTTRGADAIIADLEDAVVFAAKAEARMVTGDWVAGRPPGGPEIWVRVNNQEGVLADDISAVVVPELTGIFLPKTDGPDHVDQVVALIDQAASGASMDSAIRLGVLIETARGVENARRIAEHPRVSEVAIGEIDLGAELGIRASSDEREWMPIRSRLLVACTAAGIDPPVGPVSVDFRDLDRFRESTERLLRMGFRSRQAIHPDQVPVINEVFTPTPDELAAARSLVDDHEAALAVGRGVLLDSAGRMVDEAVVRDARRILRLAAQTINPDS
jgi:citrate lyase subunit beta/citryl-CoA lyase